MPKRIRRKRTPKLGANELLLLIIHDFQIIYIDDRPSDMKLGRPLGQRTSKKLKSLYHLAYRRHFISRGNYEEVVEALELWVHQPPIVREACKLLSQRLEFDLE